MSHKALVFVSCALILIASAQAQNQPQIYLTGTVVLAEGGDLPSVVQVQLKCHGSVVQSIYTTSGGRFAFRVNQRLSGDTPGPGVKNRAGVGGNDASIGGPAIAADIDRRAQVGRIAFRQTDLSTCQCEAALAGYQSEVVRLGVRSRLDNPDIGVIVLYPVGSVKGATVSVTTAKAPKKSMDAYRKAQKELSTEKVNYPKVVDHLQKAVDLYPEFAEAWQLLGETYLVDGNETEARNAFQHAITADPQYVRPYAVLGELELRANHIEEAAQLTSHAIELNPYLISAHYCHAVAQYYLGELDKAEESVQKVQGSNEAHLYPASHRLLGGIHAERGDYKAAAEELRRFLATNPAENVAAEVKKNLEDWERAGLIKMSESG